MKDTLRGPAAALIGALVALAVVAGSPALAHQAGRAQAKKVTSAAIKDQTIRTRDLSNEVTGPLAKAATALQQVPDNSVTGGKIAANSITSTKIVNNAVGSGELAAGSVTNPKLANDSVTTEKIVPGSVTGARLADDSVTGVKIATGSISSSEVENASLRMTDLAIAQGSIDLNFGNIAGGGCVASAGNPTGRTVVGSFLLVSQPSQVVGALQVGARESATNSASIEIVICNNNPTSVDPQLATFHWAVIAV